MILVLIFIAVFLLISTITGIWLEDFGAGIMGGFLITIMLYGVSQFYGTIVNTHQTHVHTTTKIVSLQDGNQINGHFSGGLFVMTGTINEVAWFSYYKDNGNGSYALDKQLADHSSIIPDATPETARLEADSTIEHCEKKWWSTWCSQDSGIYDHGDFHVPANSITHDFVLDAK